MVFHFYPWNLDVDAEETRLLYQENDYAGNRKVNERFWRVMSDGQKSFLAIPDFQGEFYKDAEVFGSQVPDSLKIVRLPQEEGLSVYEVDGWPCVFKHPCFHVESEKFQQWNCGYLLGSILLMKDE